MAARTSAFLDLKTEDIKLRKNKQENPNEIIRITDKISWLPAITSPFCCDIIFIKSADSQGDFTWIFDVGVGGAAIKAVNGIEGRKKVVLSHFHPDHIMNLPFVRCDELFVSRHTKKYTRRGTEVTEPLDFGDVKIMPMPSSHAKGCLALISDGYGFLGDGAFCKYKGLHHLYNPQLLKEMIDFMEHSGCSHFCLDHEKEFIQDSGSVISLYKEIYARHKNPDGTENPWINVDDYFSAPAS